MKIVLFIAGLISIGMGLYLSLLILVYTLKEQDNTGYIYLTFPTIITVFGIFLILKGLKKT